MRQVPGGDAKYDQEDRATQDNGVALGILRF